MAGLILEDCVEHRRESHLMSDESFDQVPLVSACEVFIADAIVDVLRELHKSCFNGKFCLS